MKKLILLVLITLNASCKNTTTPVVQQESEIITANFDWMLGNWQRSNEEEGLETFESWQKLDDSHYLGAAITLQEKDTVWQESVSLAQTDSGWEYQVTGKGDTVPTIFRLTEGDENGFIVENPENEFPKVIRYFKKGEQMEAVISGGGNEIPFIFEKRQP